MPILQERKTTKIKLKTDPDAEVECYESYTAGDVEAITKSKDNNILFPLSLIIKSWNYTDKDGKEIPATIENLAKLDVRDVNHIMDELKISMGDFLGETETETGSKTK